MDSRTNRQKWRTTKPDSRRSLDKTKQQQKKSFEHTHGGDRKEDDDGRPKFQDPFEISAGNDSLVYECFRINACADRDGARKSRPVMGQIGIEIVQSS
uniref:Uncharacterized protein n=1 Tax=Anopheles christyi TaxID=43041 RepID=A0A182JT88_9DIPT